jgi:hypothetical protein
LLNVWLITDPAPADAPVIPPEIVPIVQVKLLGELDVNVRFVFVPLHIKCEGGLVTTGVGFTVTTILYGAPAQFPVTDVGVTIYSTVPAFALLGLVSTWLMFEPDPELAPLILPVIEPILHVKVLGVLEVSAMFVFVPLQIAFEEEFVTTGVGFTVTVILYGTPGHEPVVDVGVMMYSTIPAVELPGLVNTWLISDPEPAEAPVMPPVTFPIVHAKLLPAVDVSEMFGLVALQIETAAGLVTAGVGFTVTVIVYGTPTQLPTEDVGVIMYSTEPAVALPGLVNTWLILLPAPDVAPVIPPVIVPIVHVILLAAVVVTAMFVLLPLQIAMVAGLVTAGVGLTVTVIV